MTRTVDPTLQRHIGIACRLTAHATTQARIDKICRELGNSRILGIVLEHNGHSVALRQRHKLRLAKAHVAYVERMTQLQSPSLARQQLQKSLEVIGLEA